MEGMDTAPLDGTVILARLRDGSVEDVKFSKYFGSERQWRDARCPERTVTPVEWKEAPK